MAQTTKIMSKNEDSNEHKNFFSLFTKFPPLFKQETKAVEQREAEAVPVDNYEEEGGSKASKKDVVKFSDPKPIIPPPLKLEADESEQSPAARWLVYALGGFLVVRWIWARWQERKEKGAKKESSNNNESQSPADEDDGYHSP